MALPPGARLGSLEIIGPLGAGGMGEVYRARDTKLGREVAVKVLPAGFAEDPDRLGRFEREAKTLAALNHPHIAQIYGLEDSSGVRALVMELVEGDDLADRMARGPMTAAEAIPLARQIADALDAAHERGIVHRDLKPANVKVRADGTVKVLDFGLAKDGASRIESAANERTITGPVEMTQPGMVMGTAGYMSPEQASGLPVDSRTDIWAFGCVLFEMLTARHPFRGSTSIETIASVIKGEPDWTALAMQPPPLQRLVRRCLQKDPKQRLHHMADVRIALDDAIATPAADQAASAPVRSRRSWWPIVAAAVVAAGIGVAAPMLWRATPAVPAAPVVRFRITPPADQPFDSRATGSNLAISPDGLTIVYHATVGDSIQLIRRNLDSVTGTPIAGTDRAQNPVFSPDGTQLAFYAGGALRKVPLSGGTPMIVCEWPGMAPFLAWLDSGEIAAAAFKELYVVPEKGGTPQRVLAVDPARDEGSFFGVSALPGGRIATTIVPATEGRSRPRLAVLPRGATTAKIVMEGVGGRGYAAGRLFFSQDGILKAVPFDLDRLEITGDPIVIENAPQSQFIVGAIGTYVALRQAPSNVNLQFGTRLEWLTHDGRADRTIADKLVTARHPRISPDGRRLAAVTGGLNGGELWIYDLAGSSQPIRVTFRPGAFLPVWRADGKALTFLLLSPFGQPGFYSVAADGSQMEPELILDQYPATPEDWRPDGSVLMYQAVNLKSGSDLMLLDSATRQTRPWLQTQFNEVEARFSPDGRWVAYASDQTGRYEIWVRPFDAPAPLVRVSSDGGHEPRWSRDGKQIFFQVGDKMMVAAVESANPLRVGTPRALFESVIVPFNPFYRRSYDVAADGRFVAAQMMTAPPPAEVEVVLNALSVKDTKKN